ncbi:UNVERIFIED_CONTAM: hypothetical protein Q9R58_25165 [Methylobacteriaceae bacterium AG10]|uniref:hypothetical protein n=1 Tax=Methylobacterium fujisawaense TaxID=107400 RepID=UPI002938334B|nr:hypothetical protein [Methylobacteriaceae bacterium AG10]
MRGRGGLHQADVLGEFAWAPAFGSPLRLFVEAKWRGSGRGRLGIPEARHAVGILQDVNQSLVTIDPSLSGVDPNGGPEDTQFSGRGFCYQYRYALCSTSGFTLGAQAYALAHQVALLDLSHADYDAIRNVVDEIGNDLIDLIGAEEASDTSERPATRPSVVRTIRSTLRSQLWGGEFDEFSEAMRVILSPLIEQVHSIGELFIGVSATGFVIILKADNPESMVRHMHAPNDPQTTVYYSVQENGSTQWQIILQSPGIEDCNLSFALPDAMLHALDEKRENGRRSVMLDFKQQHFSRITVYRMTETKSLVCSLRLDRNWLTYARQEISRRRRRSE